MPANLRWPRGERPFSARQIRERLVEQPGDVAAIPRVGAGLHPPGIEDGPRRAVDDVHLEDGLIAVEEASLGERELLHLRESGEGRRRWRLVVAALVGSRRRRDR